MGGGLTHIKIKQLLCAPDIHSIVVSTDDEYVIEIARAFRDTKIIIDHRPPVLANSSTSTDNLIIYAGSIINEGSILWTHVTSPFITSNIYTKIINQYKTLANTEYDSLMTVTKLQKFLWNKTGPINYNLHKEKWPRTQTLQAIYEVNSGVFLADSSIYKKNKNRIGDKPFFYSLDSWEATDIDWEKDFELAEQMWIYENKKK